METLRTLPGDDVRQIMWRFADRFELQMLVQSTRTVARTVVARLVADGQRNTHDWTEEKASLLTAMDDAGVTALFLDPKYGGYIDGPKNMAMSLAAFELAWVDGGAATCALASDLALAPINEKGTEEQKDFVFPNICPPQPGEDRKTWRGAFALTEPLPYVGVDTGVLVGKVRVAEWEEGQEPMLQVDKRGRFITNMEFANFVTAAVASDDPRIKTSCIILLLKEDEGSWDAGAPTKKLVHQLSATNDPVLSVKVPASRIIGGYTVKDGVIVPNVSHSDAIASVFTRTRIPVGVMTSAKLLSAVEPVIRYQRQRFRGGEAAQPGSPRYELGLQMNEDPCHRLVDVWATGEAGASLGFGTSRICDRFDLLEKEKEQILHSQGISGTRAEMKALKAVQDKALAYLAEQGKDGGDAAIIAEGDADTLVQYLIHQALTGVLIPSCKLWNTGFGATMMREAVSLMGGYGITEDCPGFLGMKWMDAQLEATYEGPESVQRRQLTATMDQPVFQAILRNWISELKALATTRPAACPVTGASALAAAMELWQWALDYLAKAKDPQGKPLFHAKRQGVSFAMGDAVAWLASAYCQLQDVLELEAKGPENPVVADGLEGTVQFFMDLFTVHAARAAGEVSRIVAELVVGYAQPEGDATALPEWETFCNLRCAVEARLAGCRLAKDRAAQAVTQVMIPEALDYPQ
ncbi:acyl-CoA dehydrogenase family protein [Megalodesulfovibrio paquesii]